MGFTVQALTSLGSKQWLGIIVIR